MSDCTVQLNKLLAAINGAGRALERVERVEPRSKQFRHEALQAMFHTTTCDAAQAIVRSGFDLSRARSHAFGVGVNLGRTTAQALMYVPPGAEPACTLVCLVAAGRTHANRSVADPDGGRDTVPVHMHPKPGFDSMTGARGAILVVADPRRVMPVFVVTHIKRKMESDLKTVKP